MESYGRAGLQIWTSTLSTFTLQREPTARMRQIRSYISTRRRPAGLVERRPSPGVAPRSQVRILPLSLKFWGLIEVLAAAKVGHERSACCYGVDLAGQAVCLH